MVSDTLIALAVLFGQLSLLAFGGGNTILPEMHRQVVDVHHWMSGADFAALFALAQAAPGPNMMVVPLIGWHVAGAAGMAVATIAVFGPSSILMAVFLRQWRRLEHWTWRRAVQAGLVPVSVGLVAASAVLIVPAADHAPVLAAITALVALAGVRTKVHPLWLLAAGAAVGWSGFGQ
jgi:chromate transporter